MCGRGAEADTRKQWQKQWRKPATARCSVAQLTSTTSSWLRLQNTMSKKNNSHMLICDGNGSPYLGLKLMQLLLGGCSMVSIHLPSNITVVYQHVGSRRVKIKSRSRYLSVPIWRLLELGRNNINLTHQVKVNLVTNQSVQW